jgi:catechol 2,3-dioxygenase-like lactoylglutathione lyase family enzyme
MRTGDDPGGAFWISGGEPHEPRIHIAFTAPNRDAVIAFHAVGLAAGGRDNGAPRLRPRYHARYFAAFVLDPDGYNIEAVCHEG